MKILAFESSCDETAAAVVEDGRKILSDAIASQAEMHALYGGVVPEIASRKHVEVIAALTERALAEANCTKDDIDAVAVTYAPGLIGAVLVGLSFAKSLAYAWGVPLIPVHHVRGHIAANYLAFPDLEPPFLALAISGGNTLIADVRDYTDIRVLGATRDDAAGECFDKAARVLGLPYPGGKPMDELAQQSRGGVYPLPHARITGAELDMSFSGLKTAVVNLAHHAQQVGSPWTGRLSPGTSPRPSAPSWCPGPSGPWSSPATANWLPPAVWPPTPSSGPSCRRPATPGAAGSTCRPCPSAGTTAL